MAKDLAKRSTVNTVKLLIDPWKVLNYFWESYLHPPKEKRGVTTIKNNVLTYYDTVCLFV